MTDEEIARAGGFHIARAQGFVLLHQVQQLGQDVAGEVAAEIRTYAGRASLDQLPPITLAGGHWDEPWSVIRALEPCRGDAGPSKEEERRVTE